MDSVHVSIKNADFSFLIDWFLTILNQLKYIFFVVTAVTRWDLLNEVAKLSLNV